MWLLQATRERSMTKKHKTFKKLKFTGNSFLQLASCFVSGSLEFSNKWNALETTAMSIKIEIYTRVYCAYCERAKELLRIKGVNFVEYDITDDQHRAEEMQQRCQRQNVPGIFINDTLIGGCTELFDLNEKGALDSMLGASLIPGGSF